MLVRPDHQAHGWLRADKPRQGSAVRDELEMLQQRLEQSMVEATESSQALLFAWHRFCMVMACYGYVGCQAQLAIRALKEHIAAHTECSSLRLGPEGERPAEPRMGRGKSRLDRAQEGSARSP